MTKLEGVECGSQGSRRKWLRRTSLRLGLLGELGLVSWALLVPAMPSAVSSAVAASSLTITLSLFEGWLIWSTLDSAQLLSLVSRGLTSFPLLPCKTDGLAHVGNIQRLDVLFLTKELSEPIERGREFGHNQHRLKVVWYFEPRHVASGEVGHHLVDGDGRVFLVADFDVHGRLEFEVGSDDTRFPVLFLKMIPQEAGAIHYFWCEITLDLGGPIGA